jgi:hypothetical protein
VTDGTPQMFCEVLDHDTAQAARPGTESWRPKADPRVAKTLRGHETDEAAMTSRGLPDDDEESPAKAKWRDSIRVHV